MKRVFGKLRNQNQEAPSKQEEQEVPVAPPKVQPKKGIGMEKGTKELGEVVKFVCALANSLGEALKDGDVTLGDAAHLIPLLYKLPSAIGGIGEIPEEVKDLSQDEIDALVKMVKEELDLPQDKVESFIEEGIEIALKLYGIIGKLK